MKKIGFFLFTLFSLVGCSDFIEYPLENKMVSLLSPKDNLLTNDSVVTFWWETHQDANFYRIQIINPNFKDPEKLIMDSIVVKDKVEFKLKSGKYQWRVRPENDGSQGAFSSPRNLEVSY
ncbi:hypothetical protein [Sphingobacterium hotanense]|uniref:hypothetical protein n=1 Tax=Sphingobacterium hotanense TaxID=649196 RepID=UPI0021A4DF0C|nr:hypothetical protein [Sphingobacterium hotanense]MCT1526453.1 hypothetical protein [Sphingobacterium hotanense]